MIDDYAPAAQADEARLVLRPNRSLTAGQLVGVVAASSLLVVGVSVLGWWQGNAFAPLYALLLIGALAVAFRRVWAGGQSAEVVAISRQRLVVHRLPDLVERFAGHPARVRLETADGRVRLVEGARQTEVGEWLNGAERVQLAERIAELLRWARS